MRKKSEEQSLLIRIIDLVGTHKNIKDIYNCATRIRLTLYNNQIVNVNNLKKIKSFKNVLWSNNELQIIVGPGVEKLTSLLKSRLDDLRNKEDYDSFNINSKMSKQNNISYGSKFLKAVSAIFGPLIPFLIGVGLLMAFQQLLIRMKVSSLITKDGVMGVDYNVFDYVLNIITGTGFKMMGVVAMWSTVRYLGGKPPIAITLGLIMVSPIIPENGVHLFEIGNWDIVIKPFYSTILVFIVMGIVIAYLQSFMDKYFNSVANFLLNPFLTLLIGGILAFFLLGPIMGIIENVLLLAFDWFMKLPFGLGTMIVGLTWQPLVVLGVHNILFFAATADLVANNNPSLFLAAAFAAAWAQMGATIGVCLRSKRIIDKTSAIAAALPGIISGPTESCIYGVNLPKGLPFITGVIAGALGGWLIGIFGVALNNLAGLGGVVGFLAYTDKLLLAILIDLVSFGLGIIITFIFWKEEKSEKRLVMKTTKKLNKVERLSSIIDYQALELIQNLRKHKKRKTSLDEILKTSNKILMKKNLIDVNLSNDLEELQVDSNNLIKNKYFIRRLEAQLKLVRTNRQSKLNNIYCDIKQKALSLKEVLPKTKEFLILLVKIKNLDFSLKRILNRVEEKKEKLASRGNKLLTSKNKNDFTKGLSLIEKSKNSIKPSSKYDSLLEKKSYLEVDIEKKEKLLAQVLKDKYDEFEKSIIDIENIKQKDLSYFKNKYFDDLHTIFIKEKIVTSKCVQ
ncbi:PTS transporter subunit EIIC [Spiroplasma apis]|uniref:PTS system sucrose-specific IIABC component n=1 Tax=Spiroplasma apis B31 TaxID=1276258 RepID=V5RI03_SPIAP|nr:PTS transporter subunit EIIC [Spiroplasma apis]AHB36317.1 PTS system sucrose-specific IIABC component [Spiroplasma apis B31]